jgi:hypothetical protein
MLLLAWILLLFAFEEKLVCNPLARDFIGGDRRSASAAGRCPYLRETTVKYCRVSAYKKLIVQTPGQAEFEKCSSEDYATCEVARQHGATGAMESRCPFLQDAQAQYCAAAAVTIFVPYSEERLSRCGSPDFGTCEIYQERREG